MCRYSVLHPIEQISELGILRQDWVDFSDAVTVNQKILKLDNYQNIVHMLQYYYHHIKETSLETSNVIA